MVVRHIRPDEYERLGALTVAAYHGLENAVIEPDYALELADIGAKITAGAEVAVALGGGDLRQVLGGVCFVPDSRNAFAEFSDQDAAGFRHLAVDPAVQRSGAGRALVEWCMARARELGRARLIIHSGTWMTGAHQLYDRLGFDRAPQLDWTPLPDVHLLGFVKELP